MGTWIVVAGVVSLVVSIIWAAIVYVARVRTWKGALCGTSMACLVGSVIGSAMVHIAMEHNPQEECVSHATGAINYAGLSEIFLSWFGVVSIAPGFAIALAARPWAE